MAYDRSKTYFFTFYPVTFNRYLLMSWLENRVFCKTMTRSITRTFYPKRLTIIFQ